MTYMFPLIPRPPISFTVLPRIGGAGTGGGGGGGEPMTPEEILAALLTVDGADSLLDADTLDGLDSTYFATQAALNQEILDRIAGDLGGGGGESIPFFMPEQFGAVSDGDPTATVAAFVAMFAAVAANGGGIILLLGRYRINAPLVFPVGVPVNMTGIARGKNLEGNSCIVSTTGTHDILKFPYDCDRIYLSNFNVGVADGVVPTSGWTIDARWLSEAKIENILLWNNCCGVDFGVGRATIVDGLYIIGIAGTVSQIGSDVWGRDCAFGVMIRSTETLLLGNAGLTTTFYDHDGPGVLVQPKAKGTNFRLRNVRVAAKVLDDVEDADSISEEYNPDAVGFDIMGASTVRMDACQAHSCRHAIRVRHAPNFDTTRTLADALKVETGKQMTSGLVINNFTSEACLQTYVFGGYEKLYAFMIQGNGIATDGFVIGDDPQATYPGFASFPAGTTPVDKFGGAGTFLQCNALSCNERGFWIRSGCNRLIEPQVAGYSNNRPGDADPGSGVSIVATTTSQRVPWPSGADGNTYWFRNDGDNDPLTPETNVSIWYRVGGSGVVATTAAPSIEIPIRDPSDDNPPGYAAFVRAAGETHVAFIVASGTQKGELGRPARLNSAGIEVNDSAVNGTWVHGGVASASKSLHQVGNLTYVGPAMRIEAGADKVFVDGLDCCEGVFENLSIVNTNVQVQNLKRSTYFYDPFRAMPVRTVATATYTFTLADLNGVVRQTSSLATTFTVPLHSAVPFPIGAELNGIRGGSGTLTIDPPNPGPPMIRSESDNRTVPVRHQGFRLVQHALDDWTLMTSAGAVGVVPGGGNAGEVLKKNTGTPYDYAWAPDIGGGGGGTGDVVGPGSSTLDWPAVYANTSGKLLKQPASLAFFLSTIGAAPATRTVTGIGLASGGGDLSAPVTINVVEASLVNAQSGTDTTQALTSRRWVDAFNALFGSKIALFTTKATPDPADMLGYADNTVLGTPKKMTFGNLVTYLTGALSFVPTTRTVTGGGLSTPSGTGGALSGNVTVTIQEATTAEAQAGSSGTVALSPRRWVDAFGALFGLRVAAFTAKAPAATDEIGYSDIAAPGTPKKATFTQLATFVQGVISGNFVPNTLTLGVSGGLISGGGQLNANRTFTVTEASQPQAAAGTSGTEALTPRRLVDAFGPQLNTIFTLKAAPVGADLIGLSDSAGGVFTSAKATLASLPPAMEASAVQAGASGGGTVLTPRRWVDAFGPQLNNNFTTKAAPLAGTDWIGIADSASSFASRRATLTTLAAFAQTGINSDNITEGSVNKFMTAAQETTLGFITATAPVNLDTVAAQAAAGAGLKTAMDTGGGATNVWTLVSTGPNVYGWAAATGGGGGEANTLGLLGTATGASIVAAKSGVILQVKGIAAAGAGGPLLVASVNANDVVLTLNEATAIEAGGVALGTVALTPRRWPDAFGPGVNALAAEPAPATGDLIGIADVSAANVGKKTTVAQLATVINGAIAAGSITDAMLRNSAAVSVIGRAANSTGVPADIAAATNGHVLRRTSTPSLAFGTLEAGAFATGPGIITYGMLQNVSAGDKVLGRITSAGPAEEIACTQAGRDLLAGANAAAQLVTLGAAPAAALHTIWVPAASMTKRTSNGPADYSAELATNKVMVVGLAFDPTADEFAQFDVRFPKSWNLGTVTAEVRWTTPSGSGTVQWGLQGLARSDDDPLDTAFGTAQVISDTVLTVNDEHRAQIGAITIAGTPAEGDRTIFQVYRDADAGAGADTLAVDAVLLGVTIFFTVNAGTDA